MSPMAWWRRLIEGPPPEEEPSISPEAPRSKTRRSAANQEPAVGSDGNRILLDDRERACGLDRAIGEVCGFEAGIERLAVGDILIGGRYLIERKSTEDFVASIIDGRLFRQLSELCSQPYEPVLILEGRFNADSEHQLSAAALRGAMLSVTLDWHVPILRSRSPKETAQWIAAMLLRLEGKPAGGRVSAMGGRRGKARDVSVAPPDWRGVTPDGRRRPKEERPSRPRRRQVSPEEQDRLRDLEVLGAIPRLGKKKARALLGRFGSLSGVVEASIFDLAETEGIGNRLAEEIHSALHGPGLKRGRSE